MWSANPDYEVNTWVECPAERPAVKAVQGSGTKLEAVRRATIKALASYVYGLDAYAEYINEIPVPDLDFFPGKLIVKRVNALNLVYAITEVCGYGWGLSACLPTHLPARISLACLLARPPACLPVRLKAWVCAGCMGLQCCTNPWLAHALAPTLDGPS